MIIAVFGDNTNIFIFKDLVDAIVCILIDQIDTANS